VLGPRIWDNVVLGFTRASESSTPAGLDFQAHVEQRAAALRSAIRKVGGYGWAVRAEWHGGVAWRGLVWKLC